MAPTSPLSLRLAAIELAQHEGQRLAEFDHGVLAAARRSGDPEAVARAEAIYALEELHERQRARAKRARDRARRERTTADADAEFDATLDRIVRKVTR